jgi:hypothetical protein
MTSRCRSLRSIWVVTALALAGAYLVLTDGLE